MKRERKYMNPKDIQPNSVEELICKKMDALPKQKMTDMQMKLLMSFMLGDETNARAMAEDALNQAWQGAAAQKRMEVLMGRKMDPQVALLIAMCAGGVGACIMYTYYAEWKLQQIGYTGDFNIDAFCTHVFPMGAFNDDEIGIIWDETKVDYRDDKSFEGLSFSSAGDNLIDYAYASSSFIKEKELETKE